MDESQSRAADLFDVAREKEVPITTRVAALIIVKLLSLWQEGGAKQVGTLHWSSPAERPVRGTTSQGFDSEVLSSTAEGILHPPGAHASMKSSI